MTGYDDMCLFTTYSHNHSLSLLTLDDVGRESMDISRYIIKSSPGRSESDAFIRHPQRTFFVVIKLGHYYTGWWMFLFVAVVMPARMIGLCITHI